MNKKSEDVRIYTDYEGNGGNPQLTPRQVHVAMHNTPEAKTFREFEGSLYANNASTESAVRPHIGWYFIGTIEEVAETVGRLDSEFKKEEANRVDTFSGVVCRIMTENIKSKPTSDAYETVCENVGCENKVWARPELEKKVLEMATQEEDVKFFCTLCGVKSGISKKS